MTRVGELEHEYLGYSIEVAGFTEVRRLATRVDIWLPATNKENDDPQVSLIEQLSPTLKRRSRNWPDDDVEAVQRVMERGLHRVRGAILLDRVQELAGATFTIPGAEQFAQRSEEYLRALVLNAFKRVFKHDPREGIDIDFDHIGVALMEGIETKDVEYILGRLKGDGLIEAGAAGRQHGCARYMPTPAGLTAADQLIVDRNAPGLLLEETIVRVENTLNKHKPELTESLRRQSIRVAEARDMSEHEVGEVAQACEQIIWDFLDMDVLWDGIEEERPARQATRDRVRLLVKSKVPSETEQDLLDALGQYVPEWFGRLEQFIHKHRHLSGESERGHAKRFVVYTYMLLGDLIEVLGL